MEKITSDSPATLSIEPSGTWIANGIGPNTRRFPIGQAGEEKEFCSVLPDKYDNDEIQ